MSQLWGRNPEANGWSEWRLIISDIDPKWADATLADAQRDNPEMEFEIREQ